MGCPLQRGRGFTLFVENIADINCYIWFLVNQRMILLILLLLLLLLTPNLTSTNCSLLHSLSWVHQSRSKVFCGSDYHIHKTATAKNYIKIHCTKNYIKILTTISLIFLLSLNKASLFHYLWTSKHKFRLKSNISTWKGDSSNMLPVLKTFSLSSGDKTDNFSISFFISAAARFSS